MLEVTDMEDAPKARLSAQESNARAWTERPMAARCAS